MASIWVHGETAGDGSLTKLSTEVATLARSVAEGMGGGDVTGVDRLEPEAGRDGQHRHGTGS